MSRQHGSGRPDQPAIGQPHQGSVRPPWNSGQAPWEIGRPQPAFAALGGAIRGRVLDVGCGTGEHTLMAAARGLDATGIDLADAALRSARDKARERGLAVRFRRHDARRLADLGEVFDTVLDSLVRHGWPPSPESEPTRKDTPAMPVAQAHVPTTRARRYLAQLGSHSRQLGRLARHQAHRPSEGGAAPAARPTEWSDTSGVIDFGWGRCTLDATDEALTLRAEADDPDRLQRIQDGIARRVERIGRRDRLTVTWQPAPPDPAQAPPANESQTATPAPADERQAAKAIVGALTSPAGRADPFPLYAAAHDLGPVLEIAEGWFLVCSYDGVNQVLRDPGFGLPDPPGPRPGDGELSSLSRSILRANPPDHPRMRSLIAQVFTPRRIAALRPAIEAAVDALLDRLAEAGADGRAVDFMDHFAFQLPVTVICELLGVPQADRDRFRPLAADLTEALELPTGQSGADPASHDPARPGPAGMSSAGKGPAAAARELAGYFTALIAQRRSHPADDLLGALVAARDADDGRLSEEELLANLILLLVAGFETTTSLLGNGLALLFDHLGTVPALRSGSLEASGFIEEVLRYDSPVQLITREARAGDRTVAGRSVPAGSQVILLIGAANRDPARYADPDRFDPARFDPARSGAGRFDPDHSGAGRGAPRPLSFGAGPHICIGNSLARLEAAVAFPRLLARFPTIRAASGLPPTRRDRLVLRGYETLPVAVADRGALMIPQALAHPGMPKPSRS